MTNTAKITAVAATVSAFCIASGAPALAAHKAQHQQLTHFSQPGYAEARASSWASTSVRPRNRAASWLRKRSRRGSIYAGGGIAGGG